MPIIIQDRKHESRSYICSFSYAAGYKPRFVRIQVGRWFPQQNRRFQFQQPFSPLDEHLMTYKLVFTLAICCSSGSTRPFIRYLLLFLPFMCILMTLKLPSFRACDWKNPRRTVVAKGSDNTTSSLCLQLQNLYMYAAVMGISSLEVSSGRSWYGNDLRQNIRQN